MIYIQNTVTGQIISQNSINDFGAGYFESGTADFKPEWKLLSQEEVDSASLVVELQKAKDNKITELNNSYNQAQCINIINGHSFQVPLKGEFFKVDIKKQHDYAQQYGSATLIAIDINGVPQIIPNIPKEMWSEFYVKANTISESNYFLKLQYQYNISQASTLDILENMIISFPAVEEIILDI